MLISLFAAPTFGISADSLFSRANSHYQNKDYGKALDDYLKLEDNGFESAPLYFNIGNCYFKEGKPGYAILYYLRAQRLDPFDEDIETNLQFARQFMPTRLEGVQINPVSTFMETLVEPFSLNGLAWIASVLFILFLLLWSAKIYFGIDNTGSKIGLYILLSFVVVSSALTTYKYRTDYLIDKGVIVADEARIYSGPGEGNDIEFVGGFGLEFEVENESGEYYLVTFENKRKGWINKEYVEII